MSLCVNSRKRVGSKSLYGGGIGYMYILVDQNGNPVYKVSTFAIGYPHKWNEFIGTTKGELVLQVLNDVFSKKNHKWKIIDEYEAETLGTDDVKDIGFEDNVRNELIKRKLTSKEGLLFFDKIMNIAFTDTPMGFTPSLNPKKKKT